MYVFNYTSLCACPILKVMVFHVDLCLRVSPMPLFEAELKCEICKM